MMIEIVPGCARLSKNGTILTLYGEPTRILKAECSVSYMINEQTGGPDYMDTRNRSMSWLAIFSPDASDVEE